MIHFEVAVAAPLNRTLTYAMATDSDFRLFKEGEKYIGRRVLVPLSRRKITGYIISVFDKKDTDFVVKSIIKFLDPQPLFHANMVPFFRWVADYYHYPPGLVIKTALPSGLAPKSVKNIFLSRNVNELKNIIDAESLWWLEGILDRGKLSVSATKKLLNQKQTKGKINKLIEKNLLKIVESVQKDSTQEKLELCYSIAQDLEIPDLKHLGNPIDFKEFRQGYSEKFNVRLKLSETKGLYYLNSIIQQTGRNTVPLKEIKRKYPGVSKALIELETKGIVNHSKTRVYRNPFGEQLRFYPRPENLTTEQSIAVTEITKALAKQKFQPFLLHGVTGCGKTEVYLQAAESTLDSGRDVLFLVPEIALATQLEAQLVSRFGDLVVLQHSGLTKAERFDQFSMALNGKAKVVVGARSALFAPLCDPGLIVVDEEHDAGFKQDDNFRYHGRDIAVVRAKVHDAVIILGSATPSITSYANAKSGKYKLLTMARRIGDNPLPKVTIVDLNINKVPKKKNSIIRSELLKKLEKNLQSGCQSILLLNRRGFSSALLCRDCGTPVQCSHCNVSLTLHKKTKRLLCHYCGFNIGADTTCFECRSTALIPAGFGIERVEEEVCELFPKASVQRLDSDSSRDRRKFLHVLKEMYSGNIDILIGTQMIAKGHHFPQVTLVGVVCADGGLSMPDFRAAERTFQLITQVTGRAGRGELPGEVIIQTLRPEHYAIIYAKKHQYNKMFEHEMRLRSSPLFPPYVRLIAIRIEGKNEQSVQSNAVSIGRFLRKYAAQQKYAVTVLGPAPSPLDKIKDNYRWQLLLKGADNNELHEICSIFESEKASLTHHKCKVIIDVDPENMM